MLHDIAIVGHGLVGASFALALDGLPLRIAIIDAKPKPTSSPTTSRPLSLSYASYQTFQRLNLWQDIAAHANPIEHIHVSEKNCFGAVRMTAKDMHTPALGYVIDTNDLIKTLIQRIQMQKNLDLLYDSTVTNITPHADHATLTLSNNQTLKARLVIAADGTHSNLRSIMGIQETAFDYQQIALSATVKLSKHHNNTAFERFTPEGTLALLPRTGQRAGVVWTMQSTRQDTYTHLSDQDFIAKMHEAIGYRLGKFTHITPRHVFPLQGMKASERIRPHIAILGNASQTIHPIAAQGFNLGLSDAMTLSDNIQKALAESLTVDDYRILQRFDTQQETQQKQTVSLTNTLVNTFSSNHLATRITRQIGLLGLGLCPPLYKRLARFGMGQFAKRSGYVTVPNMNY